MTVDLRVSHAGWDQLDLANTAQRAADATLDHLGIDPDAEIALLATGDAEIAQLNAQFRGKPTATNVLSWPAEDLAPDHPGDPPDLPRADRTGDVTLGDIALSYETCQREAAAAQISLHDHATHLIVHGVLHLLGYDHENEADARRMETFEVSILAGLGVVNPYILLDRA